MTNYLPGTIGHELDELLRKTERLPWWAGFQKWSFRRRIARVRQRMVRRAQRAADERLRELTKDWTEPERLDVEDIIAGRRNSR